MFGAITKERVKFRMKEGTRKTEVKYVLDKKIRKLAYICCKGGTCTSC